MFVAGIEIFFGVVAGYFLLVMAVSLISAIFSKPQESSSATPASQGPTSR